MYTRNNLRQDINDSGTIRVLASAMFLHDIGGGGMVPRCGISRRSVGRFPIRPQEVVITNVLIGHSQQRRLPPANQRPDDDQPKPLKAAACYKYSYPVMSDPQTGISGVTTTGAVCVGFENARGCNLAAGGGTDDGSGFDASQPARVQISPASSASFHHDSPPSPLLTPHSSPVTTTQIVTASSLL